MNIEKNSLIQFLKFAIVGVIGFLVNYAVLTSVSVHLKSHVSSEALAALIALQVTFIMHNFWTYSSSEENKFSIKKRYISYILSNSAGTIITIVIYSLASIYLDRLASLIIAALVGMVWNFSLNKIVIWRKITTD